MRKAFSFAEILISMLILSVFFLAGSKVLTQRHKDEVAKKVHGVYECYYSGNTLMEAMSKTGEPVQGSPAVNGCIFRPAADSSMYGFTIIFANRRGDKSVTTFFNSPNVRLVPPTINNNIAMFLGTDVESEKYDPVNDQAISREDYYAMVNKILTFGRNMHSVSDEIKAGDENRNGAIIVTW